MQEKKVDLPESKVDCGKKWHESLAKYDHDSCLWKTAQTSLFGDLIEFSGTWPRWGMMQNGVAFPRSMSAHLMTETEFGSLRHGNLGKRHDVQIADGCVIGAATNWQSVSATTENENAQTAENGHTRFVMRNGTVARSVAPPIWPTPQANEDAAGTPAGKMQRMLGNHPMVRGSSPEEWQRGTLNPTWVEWLMGWPIGWTACEPLATDRFRQWQRSHGVCSEVSEA